MKNRKVLEKPKKRPNFTPIFIVVNNIPQVMAEKRSDFDLRASGG